MGGLQTRLPIPISTSSSVPLVHIVLSTTMRRDPRPSFEPSFCAPHVSTTFWCTFSVPAWYVVYGRPSCWTCRNAVNAAQADSHLHCCITISGYKHAPFGSEYILSSTSTNGHPKYICFAPCDLSIIGFVECFQLYIHWRVTAVNVALYSHYR